MKLPDGERADLPEAKIVHYLLSESHPQGRHKAAFFKQFGFSDREPGGLAQSLRNHALFHEVRLIEETPFGVRYTVEGQLETPGGRAPMVRSVWFVENGETTPRFVTAYPIARGTR